MSINANAARVKGLSSLSIAYRSPGISEGWTNRSRDVSTNRSIIVAGFSPAYIPHAWATVYIFRTRDATRVAR
jgi:hypothetical protein